MSDQNAEVKELQNKLKIMMGLLIVMGLLLIAVGILGHTCLQAYGVCATNNMELINTLNNFNSTLLNTISVP